MAQIEKFWWSPASWRELQEQKEKLLAENGGELKITDTVVREAPGERATDFQRVEWEAILRTRARKPEDRLRTFFNPVCLDKHPHDSYSCWICKACDEFGVAELKKARVAARKAARGKTKT